TSTMTNLQTAQANAGQSVTALQAAQVSASQSATALQQAESAGTASAASLAAAHLDYGNALQLLASVEQQRIAALNGAATGADILKAKTDALTASFEQGKTSAADFNQALHGDTANVLASLQGQLAVAQAITG